MRDTFTCARYRQVQPVTDRVVFVGQKLCRKCFEYHTCTCDHCGSRVWAEDSCGDENHSLCRSCEARYYRRCTDCGQLVELGDLRFLPESDTDGYCPECYAYRLQHQNSGDDADN